jgi:hypothetical protein
MLSSVLLSTLIFDVVVSYPKIIFSKCKMTNDSFIGAGNQSTIVGFTTTYAISAYHH